MSKLMRMSGLGWSSTETSEGKSGTLRVELALGLGYDLFDRGPSFRREEPLGDLRCQSMTYLDRMKNQSIHYTIDCVSKSVQRLTLGAIGIGTGDEAH